MENIANSPGNSAPHAPTVPYPFNRLPEKGKTDDELQSIVALFKSRISNTHPSNISTLRHLPYPIVGNPLLNNPEKVLQAIIMYLSEIDIGKEDPVKAVERLAAVIPHETLQQALQCQFPGEPIDALAKAKDMLETAKAYFESKQGTLSPTVKVRLQSILDGAIIALDSVIAAFGIADFFRQAEQDAQVTAKSQRIIMLISFFALLTSTLMPVLGPKVAGPLIGGLLATIAGVSLIYPYIRPMPVTLLRGENWSKLYREGKLPLVKGRSDIVNQIEQKFETGRYPLLVGKSGVGKNNAVKEYVQGQPEKQVFYFNVATLVSYSGKTGQETWRKMIESIGPHSDRVVIVLDEIHLLFTNAKSTIGDELLSYLDPGHNNLPHVIGLTTPEGWQLIQSSNNVSIVRRLDPPIPVSNMGEQETVSVLEKHLLQKAPKALVEDGVLPFIYKQTQRSENFGAEAPQPLTSITILDECIRTSKKKTAKMQRKDEIVARIALLSSQGQSVGHGLSLMKPNPHREEIAKLQEELRGIEIELVVEEKEMQTLKATQDKMLEVTTKIFQTVKGLADEKSSPASDQDKSTFLLLGYVLNPLLEESVKAQSAKLGLQSMITSDLVKKVILDEKENRRKGRQLVNSARPALDVLSLVG